MIGFILLRLASGFGMMLRKAHVSILIDIYLFPLLSPDGLSVEVNNAR